MKASEIGLLTFLKAPNQFLIPIYQRRYSWTVKQCEDLWRDINAIADSPNRGHFIGSVVYIEHGLFSVSAIHQLLVIDGQQRLTTLTLLIAALARELDARGITGELSAKKLTNYYLLNSEEEGDLAQKLKLTEEDQKTLSSILLGVAHYGEQSESVITNFKFFEAKLKTCNDPAKLHQGLAKLIVVQIALDREHDNPQLIFESLNSTGLKLTQADLIRNFVLMGLEPKDQNFLYNNYWTALERIFGSPDRSEYFDRFMRDYLTMKTRKIPNLGNVYDEFKLFALRSEMTLFDIVKDIHKYAIRYEAISFGSETDSKLKGAFDALSQLKIDVINPLLLEMYDDYESGVLSKDKFISILRYIESYILRRFICGIPTSSLNKTFANIYRDIDKERYEESFLLSLSLKDSYQRFPSDDEFGGQLLTKDIYHLRNRVYFLSTLENFDHKEKISIQNFTIEHILPQNPDLSSEWIEHLGKDWKHVQNKYLHTIGNLTLSAYNSEYSDRPFAVKRDMQSSNGDRIGLGASPLRLNFGLAEVERWDETAILSRADRLIERAKRCWPYPHHLSTEAQEAKRRLISESEKSQGKGAQAQNEFYLQYWSGLRDYFEREKVPIKAQRPSGQHWTSFGIGKTNVSLNGYANNRDDRLTVAISMWGPNAPSYFEQLHAHKEEIEEQLGGPLEWRNTPGNKVRHVAVKLTDIDPADISTREAQYAWFAEVLVKFKSIFSPYVQALQAN